jgi:hypothetical protein
VFLAMSWLILELLCIMALPPLSLLLGSFAQSGLVSPRTLIEACICFGWPRVVLGHSPHNVFKNLLPLISVGGG